MMGECVFAEFAGMQDCTAAIEPTPPSSAKLAVFFRKCIELSKGAQKRLSHSLVSLTSYL